MTVRLTLFLALMSLPLAAGASECSKKMPCTACKNCAKCAWCAPVHRGKGLPPVRVRFCGACAPKYIVNKGTSP